MADTHMTHLRPNCLSQMQRRILLVPLAILPFLLILALASCGSTARQVRSAHQGDKPPVAAVATQTATAAVSPCPPVDKGTIASCSPCTPAQGQSPASLACRPCPPGPPTAPPTCFPCPPEWETPCPMVSPQPTPQPGLPTIIFCPNPPVPVQSTPGVVQLRGFVCGRGFRPAELVTVTASWSRGHLAWQLHADRVGSFTSPLPPLLCRFVPLMVVASGNEGSRSNALALEASMCPPTA